MRPRLPVISIILGILSDKTLLTPDANSSIFNVVFFRRFADSSANIVSDNIKVGTITSSSLGPVMIENPGGAVIRGWIIDDSLVSIIACDYFNQEQVRWKKKRKITKIRSITNIRQLFLKKGHVIFFWCDRERIVNQQSKELSHVSFPCRTSPRTRTHKTKHLLINRSNFSNVSTNCRIDHCNSFRIRFIRPSCPK